MVIERERYLLLALIIILTFYGFLFLTPLVQTHAQIAYRVTKEWVHIWVNTDCSIDIQYNITISYTSGSPQGIVTLGMPQRGFQIQSVKDISGDDLTYADVSQGNFYAIDVNLKQPIIVNRPYTFIVYAIVSEMIYPDNPEKVGMKFYPATFDTAGGSIEDIRVAIALPRGVLSNETKYLMETPFDNIFTDQDNLLNVYWERSNWPSAQEFIVGVSFPEKYVSCTQTTPNLSLYIVAGGFLVTVVAVIAIVFLRFRKAPYEKPRIAVEALGAVKGLTSVEAAVILDSKPVRILTMILFGLLLKKQILVTATDPVVKLQKLNTSSSEPAPKIRYYEIDYLRAIEFDGSLNEKRLAQTYIDLRSTVDRKLRGYSRADSVNYYRSVVNKAWEQVTQAGTPEIKGDAIDQNIEWLLTDDKFDEKFRTALPPELIIFPRPEWWWYWRGPHFPSDRSPKSQPGIPTPSPAQTKPIPAQQFANNIVRGLEKASNNMVKNIQDFTNKLVPVQMSPANQRPIRSQSSCVCACAHCACACACVSCACACAHGGAR